METELILELQKLMEEYREEMKEFREEVKEFHEEWKSQSLTFFDDGAGDDDSHFSNPSDDGDPDDDFSCDNSEVPAGSEIGEDENGSNVYETDAVLKEAIESAEQKNRNTPVIALEMFDESPKKNSDILLEVKKFEFSHEDGDNCTVVDCVHDTYKLELEGKDLAYDSRMVLTFDVFPKVKMKFNDLFEVIASIRSNGICSSDHANEEGFTGFAIDFLKEGDLNLSKQVNSHAGQFGVVNDHIVAIGLVDMYAKCRCTNDACKLFGEHVFAKATVIEHRRMMMISGEAFVKWKGLLTQCVGSVSVPLHEWAETSLLNREYVAVWRVDDSKKTSSTFVLAMGHPAVFLDSKCFVSGDNGDEGLCVLTILEIGACYCWYGQNIVQSRDGKATKVFIFTTAELFKNKGVVPRVFAAKLQAVAKPNRGHLFAAYGSLIKPSFEKILVEPGKDIKLNSSQDGILLPISQIHKGKKGSKALTQVTALDRANADDALLPISKILNLVDGQSGANSATSNDVVEFNDVTYCMEDRLRSEGILSNDSDLSLNSHFDNVVLKGINLEGFTPQRKMRATISSMAPSDAYKLLKSLLAMWQTRSSTGKYVLPWICCLLVNHSDDIVSKEPNTMLLESLYKLTKPKGEAIGSLLQLAGRLQLVTAQIEKAVNNKSQSLQHLHHNDASDHIDESEDEEVEEFVYNEEEESQSSSDNED